MKTAFRVALALLISLSLCVCLIPSASAAGTISSNSIEKAIAYAYNEKNTNPDDWKGWCAAFVWECYNKGAGLSNRSYGTAREMGDALITHTDANPPRGAFVFWYKTSNPYGHAGHVGLSLGDGTVIHAYSSIKVTSISTVNNGGYTYRGWGAPISGYTLETEDAPTELTLTGAVYPTGHYDSLPNFGLRGIFNSPGTITEVNATISTQSGSVYMNYTKNWNSSTYNIQTDGLNNQFTFRDLPDGFYQYYVEARDNYGKIASVSSWFSIGTITYSINYDANGGTGVPSNQIKNHDIDLVLSTIVPTRSGYKFSGWTTDDSGVKIRYQPGDIYSENASHTLIAWWDKIGITIDSQNFPDTIFRSYVSEKCDTDKDGYLSNEEIANTTDISVSGSWDNPGTITSLKGIEYFTSLTSLSCYFNQINELDVHNNKALEVLLCFDNQLTALDISSNLALQNIDCRCNHITSLDISQNTELWRLDCSSNQIASLDISNNVKLTTLDCSSNSILDLDISRNNALTEVLCASNQLTDLDVSNNGELEILWCDNNKLHGLNIEQCPKLKNLACCLNEFDTLDIRNNPKLVTLVAETTPVVEEYQFRYGGSVDSYSTTDDLLYYDRKVKLITGLPVPDTYVSIDEQNFPDPTFRAYVSENCDTDKDGYLSNEEIAAVTEISVNGQSLQEPGPITTLRGIEYFTALKKLSCVNNQITELDLSKNTLLENLSCGLSAGNTYLGNHLTSLNLSNNPNLQYLYCDNNQLTSLDVSNNPNLIVLMCSRNKLTSLNVSINRELYWLYCWGNQLTELDVSNNTNLMQFSCAQNQISQLDIAKNTGLVLFYCNNNQLTELDVSRCGNLQELSASNNQLTELDVSGCGNLQELSVSNNRLSVLNVGGCVALQKLYCSWNNLSTIDIRGCSGLQSFECGANPLGILDVSNNPALTHIGCFENQLTSLDLSNNPELQEIWCYSNQLVSLDFSSCPNLLLLSCWDNMLTHLKINQSAGLQRLFCYQNQLRYLDINANTILAQMVQNSAPTIENGVISYSETDNASYAYYLRFDEGTKLITVLVPDLILPSSLTAIEDEAFSGGAFTYVVLPDGAASIGRRAFADCPKLAYIYIPASVASIDENAFDGVEDLTIFGAPGSAADEYAGLHGFTFAAQ